MDFSSFLEDVSPLIWIRSWVKLMERKWFEMVHSVSCQCALRFKAHTVYYVITFKEKWVGLQKQQQKNDNISAINTYSETNNICQKVKMLNNPSF